MPNPSVLPLPLHVVMFCAAEIDILNCLTTFIIKDKMSFLHYFLAYVPYIAKISAFYLQLPGLYIVCPNSSCRLCITVNNSLLFSMTMILICSVQRDALVNYLSLTINNTEIIQTISLSPPILITNLMFQMYHVVCTNLCLLFSVFSIGLIQQKASRNK